MRGQEIKEFSVVSPRQDTLVRPPMVHEIITSGLIMSVTDCIETLGTVVIPYVNSLALAMPYVFQN